MGGGGGGGGAELKIGGSFLPFNFNSLAFVESPFHFIASLIVMVMSISFSFSIIKTKFQKKTRLIR